LLQTTIPQT